MRTLDALSYGPEVAALGHAGGRVRAVLRNAVYLETSAAEPSAPASVGAPGGPPWRGVPVAESAGDRRGKEHGPSARATHGLPLQQDRGSSGAIIGIVGAEAPDGPLTLRVSDLAALRRGVRGQQGTAFQATAQAVEMAEVQIRWTGARRWDPSWPQPTGPAATRGQAVEVLVRTISEVKPQQGAGGLAALLPGLLRDGAEQTPPQSAEIADPAARRMAARLTAFDAAWGAGDAAGAAQALTGLLGLGPGLTPSGDDVLMGLLTALVWQHGATPGPRLGALVAAIRAAAPHRTTRISARLLWHAGAGVVYAPAMDLGAALLRGEPAAVPAAARSLFAIGSTSGVDLAVGLLAGALIGSPERK